MCKVIFYSFYLFSKKIQFLAKNLRKSVGLNGLCLNGPILDTKTYFFDIYCQQVLVADSFERPAFWVHVSDKNLKLNLNCITKVNRWIKLDLQRVEL